VTAIEYLELGVEQYLRELPDDEYEALTRRVRPPAHIRHPAPRNGKRRNTGEVAV
jgi:hypothetical protein